MDDSIKERRMPPLKELIAGFSKQTLENYIDFYLEKLKDGYHEHIDANLAEMINFYEQRYAKDKEYAKDSHTIQKLGEFKAAFNSSTKHVSYSH